MERRDIAAEVRRFGRMLRDQWWLLALCIAAGLLGATAWLATRDTEYRSPAKVLLQQDDPNTAIAQGVGVFVDPVRQRATALELVTGIDVAARVKRQLKTKEVPRNVTAAAAGDSNIITITATESDGPRAARIADAYAKQYVEFRREGVRQRYDQALAETEDRIRRLSAVGGATSESELRRLRRQAEQLALLASVRLPDATVVQRTHGLSAEVRPDWPRTLILAGIAGLVLGLGIALLRDRLDDRLKSEEDLSDVMPGVPMVATVSRWRRGQRWRRTAAESYNNLGVAVRSLNGGSPSSFLVTSAIGRDGKSTTALNLAIALGREGRNAMLVDGDLRRPRLTEMLHQPKGGGFVKVLAGQSTLEEAAGAHRFNAEQKGSIRRARGPLVAVQGDVAVVPAGRTNVAPQRLINEASAQEILDQARSQERFVVVDGPPLGLFGDMLPLARRVDGVVIVVRLYHTRKRALRNLMRQLATVGITPVGLVVIGTGQQSDTYYGA